jgi:hypothetical protein
MMNKSERRGGLAMAKLIVRADQETASQVMHWMESIGAAKQQELAERIDAAEDRWSKLEWGAISDWIGRNGGRRSFSTWLELEGGEPKPPPLVDGGTLSEAGWLACRDASAMLRALPWGGRPRDKRLFACACARLLWATLSEGWRNAIPFAERYADGQITQKEMLSHTPSTTPSNRAESVAAVATSAGPRLSRDAFSSAPYHMAVALAGGDDTRYSPAFRAGLAACAVMVREIYDPFRKRAGDSRWLTPTVTSLANAAYQNVTLPEGHLDPANISVLADALEEAGAEEEMVAHLKSGRPHVRGCHVIDMLTGRR